MKPSLKKAAALYAAVFTAVSALSAFPAEAAAGIYINADNFPDSAFRSYIAEEFDKNGDNTLSGAELKPRKDGELVINVSGKSGIKSLKGIEHFEALTELNCRYTSLDELDVSKNKKLKKLKCGLCGITSLDVTNNTELEYLYCGENELTSLDVSNNKKLERLDCSKGKISEVKLPGTANLKKANLERNELESLDLTGCTGLEELICYENKLKYLDLTGCTALKELNVSLNELTYLDLSGCKNLTSLNADSNKLEEVKLPKPTENRKVDFRLDNNKLAFLDASGYDVGFIGWQYPEFVAVNGVFDARPLEEAGFDPKKLRGSGGIVYDEKTHTMTFDTTRYDFYYYYRINEENRMQADPKVTFIEDETNTNIFLYRSDNTIKWAKVKGADLYVLTKYNKETKKWDKLTETDGFSFDDPDTKGWRTYIYCLWVYGNGKLLGHTDLYKMEVRGYETPHGRVYDD